MADNSRLGGSIGSRVAKLVADVTPVVRSKTAKINHDTAMAFQHSFFGLMSGEIRKTLGAAISEVAEHPETPEEIRPLLRFLSKGSGQWQTFLAQSVAGTALGASLGGLFSNMLARPIGGIIARFPNGFPAVSDLATQVARRHRSFGDTEFAARAQGVRSDDFARLVRQTQHDMSPGDVLAALNRGIINAGEASDALRDAGFTNTAAGHFLSLRRQDITPQEAAELENFGVITRAQGRNIANRAGMTDDDYDRLALGGGQPPAFEILREARNRGIISRDRFEKGIQQGPIRKEWFDVIDDLIRVDAPVDTALSAVTQNLLSEGKAKQIWAAAGLKPEQFSWALETSGRPLSPEQAGELFNRRILSKDDVKQMFLESNIKNKYVDLIFRLAERLPPMELTVRMVREGAMTRAEAIDNLRQLGFTERHATALVDLGTKESTAETRALSIATIQELYESRIIGRDTALEGLKEHGFDSESAEWMLAIRDLRRARSRLNGAVNRVRTRFVAGRITDREAQNALDALQVPADARDDFLDTWEIERDVNRPLLTTSQVQQAVRRGLISPEDGIAILLLRGYSDDDAGILIALVAPQEQGG